VDAASALADLTEISSQVEAAVVFGEDGAVVASTSADESRTERLARVGVGLLEAAAQLPTADTRQLARLEAALAPGSVFVVRGERCAIVATTGRAPASGLVFHDLATCLRAVAEGEKPAPKTRRAPRKKKTVDA
jgi:predicted regulator of Ras-like GTPase activity (Roadblock/LC7/MglB family)